MNPGCISVAEREGQCFIRLQGWIRHTLCSDFDTFIDRLFSRPPLPQILVDLSEAEYLDSTTLGLLAKMARISHRLSGRRITLLSPGEDITTVLISMGFDRFFLISRSLQETTASFSCLTHAPRDERLQTLLILNAHKALMEMNEKNHKEFEAVVTLLERELSVTSAGSGYSQN